MSGVVVLGMHRSGTSAVTRVVNLLGASVGPEDDLLTNYDNPEGHWESRTLVAANDRVLATRGRSWDFPPGPAPGWEHSAAATALLPGLDKAWASVHGGTDPWVWKDPRTCLTLPLWRQVLPPGTAVLLVFRGARAVAESVRRRDGIARGYTAALWHRYVGAALRASAGMPAVCVHFEDVLAAPVEATARLAEALRGVGVALPGDVRVAAASLQAVRPGDRGPAPDRTARMVDRLTARAEAVVRALPESSGDFTPPALSEPAWVTPVLYGYRAPWWVRARLGRPLQPRPA